jgi:uncharacterized alpha-E superfamily protein
MLSRIAENLYWIGRYVERAENTARLLDVNYYAIVEAAVVPRARGAATKSIVTEQWAPLLTMTGDEQAFRAHFERADGRTVPEWLAFHARNSSSIRSSLARARENARTLRDRISLEMWEALNRAYLQLCFDTEQVLEQDRLHEYCVAAREMSHLFFGIAQATLPRDLGWYFLAAGQHLERADNLLRLLQVRYRHAGVREAVARGLENHRGMALLKSVSAYEAFRKRYRTTLEPRLIAEFLLLDPSFPRSVRYNCAALSEVLQAIARLNPGTSDEPTRQAGWLAARIEYMPGVGQIVDTGRPSLEDLLRALADISDAASAAYFAYQAGPPRTRGEEASPASGFQRMGGA